MGVCSLGEGAWARPKLGSLPRQLPQGPSEPTPAPESREAQARGRARLESAPAAAATAALGGAPPGSAASSSPTAARPRRTIACRCRFSDATRRISRRPCSSSPCAARAGSPRTLCSTSPAHFLLCHARSCHLHARSSRDSPCPPSNVPHRSFQTSTTADCSELHAAAWREIGMCACMRPPALPAAGTGMEC